MKKVFQLTDPKRKPDRQVEYVKAEINKYLARERCKALPDGVDYWNFDCKCGADATSAKVIKVPEFSKEIDKVVESKSESVYIEILARPGVKPKRD